MCARQYSRKTARNRQADSLSLYRRTLRCERLEDRCLLAVVTVTTLEDSIDFNDGRTSLREAIFATNTVAGADTIDFAPALTASGPATILLTSGEIVITDALTINGPGANRLTIDAQQQSRIFSITATSGSYEISGLTLTGGKTTGNGGALRSVTSGSLIINNCVVENSQVTGSGADGGGISAGGTLTLIDTVINNNKASGSGGGIVAQTLTLDHSTVSSNTSSGSIEGGGGISCSTLTALNDSVIRDNSTTGAISPGGGIRASNVTLDRSTVSNNKTSGGQSGGGGIYCTTLTTLNDSIIRDNSTTGGISRGGGIYATNVTLNHTTVLNNRTVGGLSDGGGVYCTTLTMTQTTVSGNFTPGDGGGIYARSSANLMASAINGNTASNSFARGGGIFSSGSLRIDQSTVSENAAMSGSNGGGGIFSRGSTQISDSTISRNTATRDGGGIVVDGTGSLTLIRSIVSNNSGGYSGGIDVSSGTTTIVGSTVVGNRAGDLGGGINCIGPLTVRDSRIVSNTAGSEGGAIFCYSTLSLTNTTIEANEAGGDGGGVFSYGDILAESCTIANNVASGSGGGVITQGSIQLLNSTVSQNVATSLGGGIWCRGSSAIISRSTIYRNQSSGAGGGIFMDSGALSLDGSIVAGNFAQAGLDATGLLGASIQARFSLIGNNSGSGLAIAPVGTPDANGNLIGGSTYQTSIDPKLVQLADNGGAVRTHALLATSPALNAGDPNAVAVPEFDQRGAPFARVYGGRIDMGAYERQPLAFANYVVDTLVDEYDGNFSDGHLSLREAIGLANADVGSAQVIAFAPSLTAQGPAVLLLTRGDLAITDTLTVIGPGAELLTIDASGNNFLAQSGKGTRVFSIDDGDTSITAPVSISGLTLTGGDIADEGGGAILSRENLTLSGSVIRDNFASTGGGIFSAGPLSLINCTVSGNTASQSGGGISNSYAPTSLSGCTIAGNSALAGNGGGVISSGSKSTITLKDSVLSDNYAARFGGGMYTSGSVILENDVVSGNESQGGGGVLALGPIVVTNSLISHNTATLYSGGGLQSSSTLNVSGSAVVANSANNGHGGGIVANGAVTLTNSMLTENSALEGGALYCSGSNSVTIAFSTIVANLAISPSGRGGGIFFSGASLNSLNLSNSIVAANSGSSGPDVFTAASAKTNVAYSLIGDKSGTSLVEAPVGSPDAKGNLIGGPIHGAVDPKVGPIAYNGGPTFLDGSEMPSRTLLPGSPAINAGDPLSAAGVSGVPMTDQRGGPFTRVYGGRIDIGAVEFQPTDRLLGDFNRDDVVDAGDYVIGRKQMGLSVPAGTGADANGDGVVNDADLAIWRFSFGSAYAPAAASAASLETMTAEAAITPAEVGVEVSGKPALAARLFTSTGGIQRSNESMIPKPHARRAERQAYAPQVGAALLDWVESHVGDRARRSTANGVAEASVGEDVAVECPVAVGSIVDEAFGLL